MKTKILFLVAVIVLLALTVSACVPESSASDPTPTPDDIEWVSVEIVMDKDQTLDQKEWESYEWEFDLTVTVAADERLTDCVFHPVEGETEHYLLGCDTVFTTPIVPLYDKGTVTWTMYKIDGKTPSGISR